MGNFKKIPLYETYLFGELKCTFSHLLDAQRLVGQLLNRDVGSIELLLGNERICTVHQDGCVDVNRNIQFSPSYETKGICALHYENNGNPVVCTLTVNPLASIGEEDLRYSKLVLTGEGDDLLMEIDFRYLTSKACDAARLCE